MLLDLINKAIKPICLIACISMVITWVFNVQNVLITETMVNGIKIKTVDLRLYLQNIQNAWSNNALSFSELLPTRTWIDPSYSSEWYEQEYWEAVINDIAFIFDWGVVFLPNLLLWILRWLAWLTKLVLALIGWNIGKDANENYYSTLIQILEWITENLFIPYI